MKRKTLDLPLVWRPAKGWLVLVGGTSDAWRATAQIDRAAVGLMPERGPATFIPAANCPAEYGMSFLEVYRRHGAGDGRIVPITSRQSAADEGNLALLRDAGLVYFGGGDTTALLGSMTGTPALDAVAHAYERGAVVVGMSAGAIGLAARGSSLGAGVLQGWSWLQRVLVSVHHNAGREAQFDTAMSEHPDMLGLGLPEDAALALGPHGQIEWWGDPEIVVKPGSPLND